jgi:hypothetical protein
MTLWTLLFWVLPIHSFFYVYCLLIGRYLYTRIYIVKYTIPARQQLGKHGLKAGIAAEAEVKLLGNGTCLRGNGY